MTVAINDIDDINECMASITIRNFEPELKEKLRIRAAHHGRSMEEEARVILRAAVAPPETAERLGDWIRDQFKAVGAVDVELPVREPMREPPKLR